jgi:hypothetical protein
VRLCEQPKREVSLHISGIDAAQHKKLSEYVHEALDLPAAWWYQRFGSRCIPLLKVRGFKGHNIQIPEILDVVHNSGHLIQVC